MFVSFKKCLIVFCYQFMVTFAITPEITPCDDDFTIDSYALTFDETNSSNQLIKGDLLDFMSNSNYYWFQNFPQKREPVELPDGLTRVDAAFFIETLDCSANSTLLIGIVGNTFSSFSIATNEWKTNQSLKDHKFFQRVLEPITDDMRIDAITDWKPNRIIVFRDQSYRVIEWQNICDALNGKDIKIYPSVKTKEWFQNSTIDAAQLIVLPDEGQNKSLFLFSGKLFKEMIVKDLNKTNGQIDGQLKSGLKIQKMFICFEDQPKEDDFIEAEPAVNAQTEIESKDLEPTESDVKKSTNPLLPIICAIILMSIILVILSLVLPKDKYIFALKEEK